MARKAQKKAGKRPAKAKRGLRRSAAALPRGYARLLRDLKSRIRTAQIKAALAVNRELVRLYWDIGHAIVRRQQAEGWGRSVVQRLAEDIQAEFPGIGGFSPQNIWRMRAFYLAWTADCRNLQQAVGEIDDPNLSQAVREMDDPNLAQAVREMDGESLPQAVGEIPWGHNVCLFQKLKDPVQRLWYAGQTRQHGWSRAVLVHQIELDAFARSGQALTNFQATLPAPQSDLARELTKDPYHFDFLTLGPDVSERQLERALIERIRDFLVELGEGFAFVGQQHHLEVAAHDYYLDLLFYHLRLGCYVVVDLKVEPFKPEFAGKMSFYLSAVDDLLPNPTDNPAIGLILCKQRDRVIVEYALRDTARPIGVARYELRTTRRLPASLKGSLPTPAQLRAELKKRPGKKGPP